MNAPTLPTAPPAPPVPFARTLTAKDRCDKRDCNAQAYILVILRGNGGELTFCLHHSKAVRAHLEPLSDVFDDQSSKLTERPKPLDD